MDAPAGRVLERLPGAVDVGLAAAGQAADDRPPDLPARSRGRPRSRPARRREAGLDHVDAQVGQGLGDLQLLAPGSCGAGRLLAVAERGVEDDDAVGSGLVHAGYSLGCDVGSLRLLGSLAASTWMDPGLLVWGRRGWLACRGQPLRPVSAEEVAAQRHPGRDTSPAGLRSRRVLLAKFIGPATIVDRARCGQGSQVAAAQSCLGHIPRSSLSRQTGVTLVRRRRFPGHQLDEGVERHGLEVLAAVAARRDALRLDLLLADHQREGDLGQLGVADLGAELVVGVVELDAPAARAEPLGHRRGPRRRSRSETVSTRACSGESQTGKAPAKCSMRMAMKRSKEP